MELQRAAGHSRDSKADTAALSKWANKPTTVDHPTAVPRRGVEGVEGEPIEARRGEDDRRQAAQGLGRRVDERAARRRLREVGLQDDGPASRAARTAAAADSASSARFAVGDRHVVAVVARARAIAPPIRRVPVTRAARVASTPRFIPR